MKNEVSKLNNILNDVGLSRHSVVELKKPLTIQAYKNWLSQGYNGEMKYMEDHLAHKEAPKGLLSTAHTAIVVALNYLPHPSPMPTALPTEALKVAQYAKGQDYHYFFKKKL